ncbi:hypothetical protein C0J52_19087 [Blattella germanica]|nr:hypothetical protein C0J52_19087 [Blattella germanica]
MAAQEGTAPIVPFLPIYARQLGFSSIIVGTIYTVLPITGMLAKPIFGAVADHFQLQKTLFLAFQIMTAISFFVIQFIPEIPSESLVTMDCDALTYFKSCNNDTDPCAVTRLLAEVGNNDTVFCEFVCKPDKWLMSEMCHLWNTSIYCNPSELSLVQFDADVPLSHTVQVGSCLHFRMHEVIVGGQLHVPYCANLSMAPCAVQCNNPAVSEVSDQPSRFGQQRLWGAVGWGLFALVTGLLVDEVSKGKEMKDYTVMFYLMLAMLILDVVVSSRLKEGGKGFMYQLFFITGRNSETMLHSQTKLSTSIVRDVGKLLTEMRIVVFMLWCISVGLCTGLQWNFLFWHLEDLATVESCDMLHWIKTIEGLVMAVQCFGGELPFLFLSGRILKKIGHVNAMSLVLFAFGLRFVIYSVLKDPWWCLPVELFQGFTFGIFYATMTSYASIVAPPGTEATVQGTVGAVFEGVGVSLGSLFGGMLYDKFGGAITFRIYGSFALALFILHSLVQFLLGRRSVYNEQARAKDFNSSARYAAPNEALHMMEDMQQLTPS